MFEKSWSNSVLKKLLGSSQLVQGKRLSERQKDVLRYIAISLKDKGFTKDMAVEGVSKLILKHGGLSRLVDSYGPIIEAAKNIEEESADTDADGYSSRMYAVATGAAMFHVAGFGSDKEAIDRAQDFYKTVREHLGKEFDRLTGEERFNQFVTILEGFITEKLDPSFTFSLNSSNKQLMAKYLEMIQTLESFHSLTDAIGNTIGGGENGAEKLRGAAMEQALDKQKTVQESGRIDAIHEPRQNQRQEIVEAYPEPLRSWILEGSDVDRLSNGGGDFGSKDNPIPVNGAIGEIKYLAKLRTDKGVPICFHRLGSRVSKVAERPVDMYEVMALDGTFKSTLYFDFYHPRRSNIAPTGFFLEKVGSSRSDPAWGYGVNSFVSDFPEGLGGALVNEYGSEIGTRLTQEIKGYGVVTENKASYIRGEDVSGAADEEADLFDNELDSLWRKIQSVKFGAIGTKGIEEAVKNGEEIISSLNQLSVKQTQNSPEKIKNKIKLYQGIINYKLAYILAGNERDEEAIKYYEEAIDHARTPFPGIKWIFKLTESLRKLERYEEEGDWLEVVLDECYAAVGLDYTFEDVDKSTRLELYYQATVRTAQLCRMQDNYEAAEEFYGLLEEYIHKEMVKIEEWVLDH